MIDFVQNLVENNKLDLLNKIDTGLESLQKDFLQSKLGEVVDNAIDMGIKSLTPDLIEDQIINIKDSLFQNGIKEAIDETVSSALDLGKSAIGIFTGEFENISQIEQAVKKRRITRYF